MRDQRKWNRGLWRIGCILLLLGSLTTVTGYAQTALEKAVALAAIKAKWESLPGVDGDADNAELLAFLRTRPEFSDSGIVDGSSCVWARFNDGRTLILANNFDPGPPSPATPSQAAFRLAPPEQQPGSSTSGPDALAVTSKGVAALATAQELPRSRKARLIHTIKNWPTAVSSIRPWLVAGGYDVVDDPGTLASLRTVSGDGVLYLEAHGGPASTATGGTRFAIYTATELDLLNEDSDPVLKLDLDLDRVVYFAGKEYIINPVTGERISNVAFHYGITDKFVWNYWNFAANSFVYLTVCSGDGAAAQDFKDAIIGVGAGVYAGWSKSVTAGVAINTAKLVFDRFLGANDPDASPEAAFKQRPFNWQAVGGDPLQSDLAKHNLGIDIGTGALLSFTPKSVSGLGDFGLLAPSIILETPIEIDTSPYHAGTLFIAGTFGSNLPPDPDNKVTVGGLDCPLQADGWHPDYIVCDLPRGAAGDVVVTVRKHDSNKARLTKWTGTFRYTVLGGGSLRMDVTYSVAFRGDIRKSRSAIHDPPVGPLFTGFNLIPDESSASYVCSGSEVKATGDITTTITWSGAGSLSAARAFPLKPNFFQIVGDLTGPNVQISVAHGGIADAAPGCDWTLVITYPPPLPPVTITGHDPLVVPQFDIGAMAIEPDDPSFLANSRNLTGDFFCSATALSDPQCRMQWDDIRAQFPPDPKSAR